MFLHCKIHIHTNAPPHLSLLSQKQVRPTCVFPKSHPQKLASWALCRDVLPKTVSITISTHVSSWDTMMKSNSRKMSITMNKYSESMKSSNQREIFFQKKMSWVKVPMRLNTVKTKKLWKMQRICHASTRKCVHVHGNYMIQIPSESSLVSFRAFFWGRNWHQPSTVGWVPNIDLIEHLLKFQETKPHGPSLGPKLVARVSLSKKVACCSWCD